MLALRHGGPPPKARGNGSPPNKWPNNEFRWVPALPLNSFWEHLLVRFPMLTGAQTRSPPEKKVPILRKRVAYPRKRGFPSTGKEVPILWKRRLPSFG